MGNNTGSTVGGSDGVLIVKTMLDHIVMVMKLFGEMKDDLDDEVAWEMGKSIGNCLRGIQVLQSIVVERSTLKD